MERHSRKHPPHTALKALVALILALVATDAWAVVLYKLTDPQGRVTYTDSVPKGFRGDVKRLEIAPAERSVNLATAPLAREAAPPAQTDYERIIRARPEANGADERIRAARARLEAAQAALKHAQENSTAEDWIYFGPNNPLGMRRAPRPEYQARLEQLENELRHAEEQLSIAERG